MNVRMPITPRRAIVLAVSLSLHAAFTGPAFAAPILDGDISDVIAQANIYIQNGTGCGIVINDPAKDVCLTDPTIVPCTNNLSTCAFGSTYFLNGFDQILSGAAVQGTDAWWGIRTNGGQIGDTDGDGTDAKGVCANGPQDPPGIGFGEGYEWDIDTNCDGVTDFIITVSGGTSHHPLVHILDGIGNPVPGASGQAQYGTTDLEVHTTGLVLPPVFEMSTLVTAQKDGLSEDGSILVKCNPPVVTLSIQKTVDKPTICPGDKARFTVTVTNNSLVDVVTSVRDVLPAGWTYADNVSGDFAFNSQNGQVVTFGPLSIPAGATRTVSFDATSPSDCLGPYENKAVANGSFSSPCLTVPSTAQTDTARATVTCLSKPCVTERCEISVPEAAPGSNIVVSGFASNCSSRPADIIVTIAGGSHAFANVSPGVEVRFDTTLVMPACQDGNQVSFNTSATASNDCGQSSATSSCSVVCRPKAPCAATTKIGSNFNGTSIVGVGNGPAYVWFNSNFTVKSGTILPGTQLRLRGSTVVINGTSYAVPDANITFQAVSCATTTFDVSTKTWNTIVPLAGSDEIFFSGLVLPLLSLSGGATVSWSGSIETDTPGICVSWKWGAAVYKSWPLVGGNPFAVDYNAAAIKPTHSAACGINNGDHAGTPQNPVVRGSVTGGARGGGGSNFTGSWSGTSSVCLVCPPQGVSYERGGGTGELRPTGSDAPTPSVSFDQPTPNPFASSTSIDLSVTSAGENVRVGVYDVAGRLIRSLEDGSLSPGQHRITWDGRDTGGSAVAHGVYFLRVYVDGRPVQGVNRVLYLR